MKKAWFIVLSLMVLSAIAFPKAAFSAEGDQGYIYLGNERYLSTTEDANGYEQLNIITDHDTSDIVTLSWNHELIHHDRKYQLKRVFLSVPNTGTVGFVVFTPPASTSPLHLFSRTKGLVETSVCIWEGITGTPGAEATDVYFKKRDSTTTRNSIFYERGSVTGLVCIDPDFYGDKKDSGGDSRNEEEWVPLPATSYLVEITCNAVGGGDYLIWLDCYEKWID